MPYLFEKLKENSAGLDVFRLTHSIESIDIVFSRENFREVLTSLGFSSNRIGSNLGLLNKQYPPKIVRPSLSERYSERVLIEQLRERGFKVFQRNDLVDIQASISLLEQAGYCIEGPLGDVYYRSPYFYVGRN